MVARRAHNPKVVGSNPAPATKYQNTAFLKRCFLWPLFSHPIKIMGYESKLIKGRLKSFRRPLISFAEKYRSLRSRRYCPNRYTPGFLFCFLSRHHCPRQVASSKQNMLIKFYVFIFLKYKCFIFILKIYWQLNFIKSLNFLFFHKSPSCISALKINYY